MPLIFSGSLSNATGYLKKGKLFFIRYQLGSGNCFGFQVAFAMCVLFPFAPYAGAGTFFSLLRQRKESKRKATAGAGLASPNFPPSARFFGRARNLRLRRFEHASPCSPKNRAPFGCASMGRYSPADCTKCFVPDFKRGYFY